MFVVFARDKPPTPPCAPDLAGRALVLDGLKHALRVGPFWFYLLVSFVGLGIFNGVTTWVESIVRPRGFTPTQAGTLGAVMLVGGVLGAVIVPAISDRQQKRQRYLMLGVLLAIPGVLGLAFATSFPALLAAAFVLGFFLISTGPIGMQYAAEITYPAPEGTSNGLIQLFGQASVVFVYVMEAMKTDAGAFTPALLFTVALLLVSARARDPDEGRALKRWSPRAAHGVIALAMRLPVDSAPEVLYPVVDSPKVPAAKRREKVTCAGGPWTT